MDFQKSKNLYRFMNVLCANQAKGQRRFLRAICSESYKANFVYCGKEFRCILRDISISHFSCIFPGDGPEFPMHEKICGIQMNLKGILIKTDAVLCLKRVLANDTIHVFVFRTNKDREGLNPDHQIKVNGIIQRSLTQKIMVMLKDAFLEKGKQTRYINSSDQIYSEAMQGN